MPLVDLTAPDIFQPTGQAALGPYRPPAETPSPGIGATLGAAFRQDNILASIGANNLAGVDNNPEEGYNAWQDIAGTKYERHWERFATVNNRRYAAALKMQFDMEEDDRRTLAAAGVPGMVASLAAGILDPTILLPGGTLVKTGSLGYSVSRSALAVGMAAGAGVAVQEAFLQGTQETRSMGESAINVGGGVVLGALLGGAAARLLSPGERAAALRAADSMAIGSDTFGDAPPARGLSAQAVEQPTLDDLSVAGRAAGALAKVSSFLSPQMRMAQNPSPVAQRVFQEVNEIAYHTNMNRQGRTLGPAIETLIRSEVEPKLAAAYVDEYNIYKEMTKAGVNMDQRAFSEATARAARRNDTAVDGNEYVSRAAQMWRSRIIEPFKQRAIDAGLLPEGVSIDTAASYLTRMWDREILIAKEMDARERFATFFDGQMRKQYAEQVNVLNRRLAANEQQIADMRLSPEERLQVLARLDEEAKRLDAENAAAIDARTNIRDLERAAKENPAVAAQNQQEIARIRAMHGERIAAWEAAAREMRRRRRSVQMGYAATAEKAERTLQSIADAEEVNFRAMGTLLRKGQEFAGSGSVLRANPKQYAERANGIVLSVDNLAKALERTAQKADDSIARIVEQSAKTAEAGKPAPGGEKMLDFLRKNAEVARQRAAEMRETAERLKITRDLDDLDELRSEISEAMDVVARQASGAALARGAHIERLRAKLPGLDPKMVDARIASLQQRAADLRGKFNERWRTKLDVGAGSGPEPSFREFADQAAKETINKILGRHGDVGFIHEFQPPLERGPLKDRVFPIPDELVEDLLVNDMRHLMERYARVIAVDSRLANKYNGRPDMADAFVEIRADFDRLREATRSLPQAQQEKKLKELNAAQRQAEADISATRDILRGTYSTAQFATNFGRASRALTNANYILRSGGMALSSLSEFYRPAMVHGLVPYLRGAIMPLLTNLDAIRLASKELKPAGLVIERATLNRLFSVGEIGDPYAKGSAIERVLEQGSRVASKWNFLPLVTDWQQMVAGVMSQNRILELVEKTSEGKKISAKDVDLLRYLGINERDAETIHALSKQYGEVVDSVRVAGTERWGADNERAVEVFRAALNKDVHTTIVRPGVADLPLFARTPLGRLLFQFQSFAIAGHQRVTLRGLQENQARFVGGMIAFTAFGMAVAYLKSLRQGEEAHNRFVENAKNNPFFLIAEGYDNANPTPLMMNVSNITGRLTQGAVPGGFNPIKTPIRALGGSTAQESVKGNYVDIWGTLLGPTGGLASDALQAASGIAALATGETPKESQMKAGLRMVPFGAHLGMREGLQMLYGDSPYLRTR